MTTMNMLKNATVLITGASGFIGGRLAERLVQEQGAQVRALVRSSAQATKLAALGCEPVLGDLTDPASLQQAVAGCAYLFHAGAWVRETGRRDELWAVNVAGTKHLAEAASAAGVQRFIHLSSCAVYGSPQRFGVDERAPMQRGASLYANSKIAAEDVIWHSYQRAGLPVVVARPSQVYGLGSPQFTLRPVQMIRAGKLVLVDGGRHWCKPLYIDNLVDGLVCCATIESAVGQAYNLSDGDPVRWRDFFGAYVAMLGAPPLRSAPRAVVWLAALVMEGVARLRRREASLNRRVVRTLCSDNSFSNQKAQQQLGWSPLIDLAEGMRRTEQWLRIHGYLD
jgi:nucleoside-diphosphate-sugar epimerase